MGKATARLNKFLAHTTGLSRREADEAIEDGRVKINGEIAEIGARIADTDKIMLDGQIVTASKPRTIIFNKPVGYVCSRRAQGAAKTIYDILPPSLSKLKTVGRLDRDSSGLVLLTSDGDLAHRLTHPKFAKTKVYVVELDKPLAPLHQQMISDFGVNLDDGASKLLLAKLGNDGKQFQVTMSEGRNRQIRRTFASLGYTVMKLHRTNFGGYALDDMKTGEWREL